MGVVAIVFAMASCRAHAQEMEPRSYSAAPVGTNFVLGSFQHGWGDVALDASLPISNVKAVVNAGALGYSHTFGLFGQTGAAAVLLPYVRGDLSGDVDGQGKQITREGQGDIVFRFSQNLIGSPALTPEEFARRSPETTFGVSLAAVAPTGAYHDQYLINVSSHRWAFRPEIGGSHPIGNWFVEGSAGMWVFTPNTDFYGGHLRGQEPLWTLQAHIGYNFGPGFWVSLDANQYMGGRTSMDGVTGNNYQSVFRYGATISVPLGNGFSAKASWGSWLTAHNGGAFDRVGATLQYRWFDR
jgi:hypothetical protein